jgi:hypothetical protein
MAEEAKSSMKMPKNMTEFETMLDDIFGKKAPALPENAKEFLVKAAPYLSILGVVMSLPAIFAVLGLGAIAAPFAALGGVSAFAGLSFSIIFLIINVVLMVMAIPGLFKRSMGAWRLMFYSTLVSAVSSLVSFSLGGLIIGTAIGFYFLFQLKSYYK